MTRPIIMLMLSVAGWIAVAVFDWLPSVPTTYVAPMPADGSAPPLPPPIQLN